MPFAMTEDRLNQHIYEFFNITPANYIPRKAFRIGGEALKKCELIEKCYLP